jgi:hypothetical protein
MVMFLIPVWPGYSVAHRVPVGVTPEGLEISGPSGQLCGRKLSYLVKSNSPALAAPKNSVNSSGVKNT